MILNHTIPSELSGSRLDDSLSRIADISKGEARRIIDRGGCAVNQAMVRVASRAVKEGDTITAGIMAPGEFVELALPEDAIVYQDRDLIVVNKPSGVASQRTPYQLKGTLEYWIAEEFARQGIKEPVRVVHRLDRGTSGLMLFPKNRQSAAWLSGLFSSGKIQKRYLALVSGIPERPEWKSDGPIGKVGKSRWGVMDGGRPALTEFRALSSEAGVSLIEAFPKTGRTHQIRVHLSAAGFPIIGDTTYGGVVALRLMLHCASLCFEGRDRRTVSVETLADSVFMKLCGNPLSSVQP